MRFFDLFSHLLDIRHRLSKSGKIGSSQGKSTAGKCRYDSRIIKETRINP